MTSRRTTFARSLIKAAAVLESIALAAPAAPALAASGPSQVLYIFPGVADDGGGTGTNLTTVVHRFSFSLAQETFQFVVRNFDGSILKNTTFNMNRFQTVTVATHGVLLYTVSLILYRGCDRSNRN